MSLSASPCINHSRAFQWAQLLIVTSIHFYVDIFASMMAALLPEVREIFHLSLTRGLELIVILGLVCNGMQILTGHLRAQKQRPVFMPLGLILGSSMSFLAILADMDNYRLYLYLMVIVSGTGIALVHPEGLRAIHNLEKIPSSISTAVFMTGGFVGYAGGAWISTEIVIRWGMKGLLWLPVCTIMSVVMMVIMKIRLAVETEEDNENTRQVAPDVYRIPFWPIFVMTVFSSISTTVIVGMLPTLLNELEFALDFGGFSVMVLGVAGAIGSLAWGGWAHRKGELQCCVWALFLGLPFFVAYQFLLGERGAFWVLVPAGFCSVAAYPLMVTLARHCQWSSLGQRMALVVGGAWGIAAVALWIVGPIAEHIGVKTVMNFAWLGYLTAGIIGIYLKTKWKTC